MTALMVIEARRGASESASPHVALTIALLILAALALLIRVASIAEPLGIDQGLWASAVRGMSRGQLLYQDVWEQRPPGIYLLYLTGFQVLGWSASTVAWLDILAATATTILLFRIGLALSSQLAGATAAALYATLTMPAWLYRYGGFLERSVCETFIVVCVGLSLWCAIRYRERRSLLWVFGAGVGVGIAIIFKPNAGLYLLGVVAWMALYARAGEAFFDRRTLHFLGVAGLGVLVVPVATMIWVWQLGILPDAKVAVVDFNRFYVGLGFSPGDYVVAFARALWLRLRSDPLWLAGAIGAVVATVGLARSRRCSPLAGLALLWGASGTMVIVVNGMYLFNSYFLQLFAPLALMTAWVIVEAPRTSQAYRWVRAGTLTAMFVLLAVRNYPAQIWENASADARSLLGRVDRAAYLERFGGYANARGYSARANTELADYVRAHTAPDDRIFLFGINGASVYFEADRLPAHRFLRANFFIDLPFPDPDFRLVSVTEALEQARPTYVIFERLNSPSAWAKAVDAVPEDPAVQHLLRLYRWEAQIEDFTVYRRIE